MQRCASVAQAMHQARVKALRHGHQEVDAEHVLFALLEQAEDFAREVGFMSIGTNDLIQYMLAVDRTNAMVSRLYLSYHPAILRAIEHVAAVGKNQRTDVSICGDIVRDPKMIPFLLGVDITKLSVAPRRIRAIQQAVEAVSMEKAVYNAHKMLECSRISEVEAFLSR